MAKRTTRGKGKGVIRQNRPDWRKKNGKWEKVNAI